MGKKSKRKLVLTHLRSELERLLKREEEAKTVKEAGIEANDVFVMVEFLNEEEIAEVARIRDARKGRRKCRNRDSSR